MGSLGAHLSRQRRADDSPQDWAARWREGYRNAAPGLPRRFWAWQFLRRNLEYRAEWKRVLARAKAAPTPEEGIMPDPRRCEEWRETVRVHAESPAFVEFEGKMLPVAPLPALTFETIYDLRGRERWGLVCGYHDPCSDFPEKLRFIRSCGVLTMAGAILHDREGLAPDVRDWNFLATFDVSRDLRAQLRIVGTKLRNIQRPLVGRQKIVGTRRPQNDLLRFHLFLLDVSADGATPESLVAAFDGRDPIRAGDLDVRKIGDRLAKAIERIEPRGPGGYLALAELDDDSPV